MSSPGSVRVAVSVVLLTLEDGELRVVLKSTQCGPHDNQLNLIGGVLRGEEQIDLELIVAKLLEKSVGTADVFLEQLATLSGVTSNNEGRPTVQVCYIALMPESLFQAALQHSPELKIFPVESCPTLPDHGDSALAAAVTRLRGKGAWTVMPAYLLDREFTVAQLGAVYDAVVGTTAFGMNFRNKILRAKVLTPTGTKPTKGATRLSEHYSVRPGAFDLKFRL
ncbi:hypothetical protein ASE04_28930 [Rhizobium sp. Root708]|uniref:NrtR DNA-binding winged helix domain-containing protein n=1 Tax=Rhizobium sp. Root708 TaxID=1736592 RepID=UPI0006FAC5BD|nr:hypothetical protein [Rhizobium sp. Root708]KRB56179.1 hypothetical protein ASE04_28930 [Rhizobium sp. Root708]